MKRVRVEYWGFGFGKSTTTLIIDDQGLGVLDGDAHRVFESGQCHALALAIHELTGWPIKGLGHLDLGDYPDSPAHCVVWCPKLKAYVDIHGKVGRGYYRKERGWVVINHSIPPEQVNNLREYLKPNMRVARPYAKAVLRDLGFSTAAPK